MQISQLRIKSRQRGQGMTEYIIIVALIAVAAIGAYTVFGKVIRNQTQGMSLEMSGQSGTSSVNTSQETATNFTTDAAKTKGLSNFQEDNVGNK